MTLPPKIADFRMLRKEYDRFSPDGEVLLHRKSTGRVMALPYNMHL